MKSTSEKGKWGILIATLVGSFTVILNNSLMNVALPYFMDIYQLTAVEAQWIVTAFALAMSISMPLTGYLGKMLGQKRVYLFGIVIFLFGSIFGAVAWNFPVTILFRFVQGLGGGLIMPLAMILIFNHFPKNERGVAMGIWGVAAMIAPTIGPTVGGAILNFGNWQMLFLLNVPTALVTILASVYFLPKNEERKSVPFDWLGFLFISVGLISLMIGIDRLQSDLEALWVVFLFALGIISIVIFIRIELRASNPLLDLRVFLNPVFTASLALVTSSTAAMFSVLLLIPLYIQDILHESPLLTGFLLLPQALVMGLAMTLGGRILDRKGPFAVVVTGLILLMSITFLLGGTIGQIPLWFLVCCLAVHGFGNGFINTPATTAGMNALSETQVPAGSALNNVLRQMMKVTAVVFISMFFEARRGMYIMSMPQQEAGILAVQQSFLFVGALLFLSLPLTLVMRKKG